jgi:hypothetical protein
MSRKLTRAEQEAFRQLARAAARLRRAQERAENRRRKVAVAGTGETGQSQAEHGGNHARN